MSKLGAVAHNKSLGGSALRYLVPFRRRFDTADVSLRCHNFKRPNVIFLEPTTKETHENISVTVKTVGGISLCDGGKLKESEGYNYFFVVFCVLKSK